MSIAIGKDFSTQLARERDDHSETGFLKMSMWLRSHARLASMIVLIASLVPRLYLTLAADPHDLVAPDSGTYFASAVNLLVRGEFLNSMQMPEVFRTPGYPVFLVAIMAATGRSLDDENLRTVLVVQTIILSMSVLILYWLARRILPSVMAFTGALLAACSPWGAVRAGFPLTEGLFVLILVLLFMVMYLVVEHARKLSAVLLGGGLIGLLTSAAVFVRPIWPLVPLVAIVLFVLCKDKRRMAWMLVAVMLVFATTPIYLWKARNLREAHFNGLSIGLGENAYRYFASSVKAQVKGAEGDRWVWGEAAEKEERQWSQGLSVQEMYDERWRRANAFFREHPFLTVYTFGLNASEAIVHPDPGILKPAGLNFPGDTWVLAAIWGGFLIFAALGLGCTPDKERDDGLIQRKWLIALLAICLPLTLASGITFGAGSRLRAPLELIVPLLAAIALVRLVRMPRENKISLKHSRNHSRAEHWEQNWRDAPRSWGSYYHRWLQRVYAFVIPKGARVLELGCGSGDLLASLQPRYGVGIDFAPSAIEKARARHPGLRFEVMAAEALKLGDEPFDFIILSDLVNDLWDVQTTLAGLRPYCHPGTRLILNFYSHLWQIPLQVAQKLRVATPTLAQNWLTRTDMRNLLTLEGFELLRDWSEMVVPLPVPGANWCNRFLPKVIPFHWVALANFIVGRPAEKPAMGEPTCTVVVAARNEEGHIEELFTRIPEMGPRTEIIFVEGNSKDDTYGAIERAIVAHPGRNCRLLKQPGKGKGDAVRAGFAAATGDVLVILDADMTVLPEDLPRFYAAIASGKGEFINGVRLVYPMEHEAMRFFNLVGNKFFAAAFSWLLGQPIRDTLCGTKVIWRNDYERLVANRAYFGDFDPFGDFDLILGAAKLNLKILEVPIRYHSRRYGETNISRWRHGLLLLRMVIFASRRIKFF
jgi:SAM-dependent methyltransferase/4-amino-4-deoxy-L-arabinose transferase-like glycosyltransferase